MKSFPLFGSSLAPTPKSLFQLHRVDFATMGIHHFDRIVASWSNELAGGKMDLFTAVEAESSNHAVKVDSIKNPLLEGQKVE